ncbi:MAG: TraE protein [Gammaproteobacteria bacterium]|jgi:type IV conjugative transfer system protein TraE|nr:TraE protein [Gammaproteobacteria bacterium]
MSNRHQFHFIDFVENQRQIVKILSRWNKLLVILLSSSFILIAYVMTHHESFLIPFELEGKASISARHASDNYLSTIALSDVTTYFNFTPETIEDQSGRFLKRLDPTLFGSVQVQLADRQKGIKQDGLSEAFFPGKIEVLSKDNTVKMEGKLWQGIADKSIGNQTQSVSITVGYRFVNGLAYINRWHYEIKK